MHSPATDISPQETADTREKDGLQEPRAMVTTQNPEQSLGGGSSSFGVNVGQVAQVWGL